MLDQPFDTFINFFLRDDPRLRENADDIVYGEELSGPYHLPQVKVCVLLLYTRSR